MRQTSRTLGWYAIRKAMVADIATAFVRATNHLDVELRGKVRSITHQTYREAHCANLIADFTLDDH